MTVLGPAPRHLLVAAALAWSSSALAQDRPITDREPDAVDVAKTPMTDLNLSRTEIPALLVEAQQRPYSLVNLKDCAQLVAAVEEFDRVLGPDLDLPQAERSRFSKGRIAQWAVGTFIPFRSLIREISGANRQQREITAAVQAGLARRAFLKGVGSTRNCPYPASPATETIVAQHTAALAKSDEAAPTPSPDEQEPEVPAPTPAPVSPAAGPGVTYKSEPVVQRIP